MIRKRIITWKGCGFVKTLFENLTILDLTENLPGPYCTTLFADLGANVIKIERLDGDPARAAEPQVNGMSAVHHELGRNKKSIGLNLKESSGQEVFRRLVPKADVIIEGFRPGVVNRLGIGYEEMKKVNDQIIYCSISGYGQNGPYSRLPGHDLNYISLAGILGMTGTASGQLVIPGGQIADIMGGAMMAAFAISSALYYRSQTGHGQYIDISMLDGAFSMLSLHLASYQVNKKNPQPSSMPLTGAYPCYDIYPTADSRSIAVGALETPFWEEICRVINEPELIDKQFAEGEEGKLIKSRLTAIFKTRSSQEWFELLSQACVTPVLTFDESLSNPQILSRGLVTELETGAEQIPLINCPIRFSKTPAQLVHPAPRLGEHTLETLLDIGYSHSEIKSLQDHGVITKNMKNLI